MEILKYKGNVIAFIWLIGLGILILLDFFWPGILVVIGISMVARRFYPKVAVP
jgi:hypothetical protein